MSEDALARIAYSGARPDRVARLREAHPGDWAAVAAEIGASEAADEGARLAAGRSGIDLVTGDRLPTPLHGIPEGPHWLFTRGVLPEGPAVAIVGSRRPTPYGEGVAHRLAAMLGAGGWVVVSGLALGIDGRAHRGALDAGGATVAILGSGIDVWYPHRHRTLGEGILEAGGAVVSEFPPGTPPAPWRFPCRNRIIAGWASVVVVVEAAERSGALITARLAAELGREVLALPGDIDRPTSRGANLLIRDGAHPFASVEEAVEMVERVTGPPGPPAPRHPPPEDDPVLACLGPVPRPVDDVIRRCGMPAPEALAAITRLELSGRICRVDGGIAATWRPGVMRGTGTVPP